MYATISSIDLNSKIATNILIAAPIIAILVVSRELIFVVTCHEAFPAWGLTWKRYLHVNMNNKCIILGSYQLRCTKWGILLYR